MGRKKLITVDAGVIDILKEALSSARLENCGIEKVHQEAFKLYLDSWVAGRIENAICLLKTQARYQAWNHSYQGKDKDGNKYVFDGSYGTARNMTTKDGQTIYGETEVEKRALAIKMPGGLA